jgi:hypothetical protein
VNPTIKNLQEKIAKHGLNEVVAAKWRADGFKVASMIDPAAFAAFGAKLYIKSAEYRRIMDGIAALKKLQEG